MLAGLILAGGQGSRLGGTDKALLELGGETLLARAQARLAPQVAALALSANGDPARFGVLALPVLPDDPAFAGRGPLAGVLAGLTWAENIGATALLTLPVDTPFFPDNLAASLSPAPAVAVWRGRQHHLVATWPTSFRAALAEFLAQPSAYKVRDALSRCGAAQVDFGAAKDPFLNINTPDDLAAAQARLA
ncbi:MAG: molybdenum cofactor guanylyltransferase [Acidocella sp. 20-63-7]|nr:MAG: molybdenum cofactor guanylyltransferase [Acidocella sp. 20-63-7]